MRDSSPTDATASTGPRCVVLGGSGMIGRPVVRAMHRCGLPVTVAARRPDRARAVLPTACTMARVDLADDLAVDRLLAAADAVVLTLNTPYSPRRTFDADRDGTTAVLASLRRLGSAAHVVRLSALGVPEGRGAWWAIERKATSDAQLASSGQPYTIVQADWLMETLMLLVHGPAAFVPSTGVLPLHWIAGEDLGRMIASAVTTPAARGRTLPVQGPQEVTFADAVRRVLAALEGRRLRVPVPGVALAAAGIVASAPAYLRSVLEHTRRFGTGFRGEETWSLLGRPTIDLEQYVASIAETGDRPRKGLG